MSNAAEWTEKDQARADFVSDLACEISADEDIVSNVLGALEERGLLGVDWSPISTAPRDGSRVMLAVHDTETNGPRLCIGEWHESVGAWDSELGMLEERDNMSGDDHEWPPTHWKPLPQPPCLQKTSGDVRT